MNLLRTLMVTTALLAASSLSTNVLAQSVQLEITDPPANHHFGKIPLAANYAAQYFSLFNRSSNAVQLGKVSVDGGEIVTCAALGCPVTAVGDFVVGGSDGCSNAILQPNQGCSTLVGFVPTEVGARTARLVFPVVNSEVTATRILQGTGTTQPLDCVLDWAEQQFPSLLSSPTATFRATPFYARCYQGNSLCIGADAAAATLAAPSVYLYQNQNLQLLGKLSDIATTARCTQN
jgi:hypothetical protein